MAYLRIISKVYDVKCRVEYGGKPSYIIYVSGNGQFWLPLPLSDGAVIAEVRGEGGVMQVYLCKKERDDSTTVLKSKRKCILNIVGGKRTCGLRMKRDG
jgi:hypothetical protein